MRRSLKVSDELIAEHDRRCTDAGCVHAVFYDYGDGHVLLGWCTRCRQALHRRDAWVDVHEREVS